MDWISTAAAAALLAGAFVTDVRSGKISNKWTLSFLAGAIIYYIAASGLAGIGKAAAGAAAGFVPLLLLYMAKGIGAGDVKLFGALGAWVGPALVLQMLLYSILYAGAIAVGIVVVNRAIGRKFVIEAAAAAAGTASAKKQQWLSWGSSGTSFPFMLAAVPGAITVALLQS